MNGSHGQVLRARRLRLPARITPRTILGCLFALLAVITSGVVALLLDAGLRSWSGFGWTVSMTCVIGLCVIISTRALTPALEPLGPWVSAVRGALIGFLLAAVVDVWLAGSRLGPGPLVLVGVCVLAVMAVADSTIKRCASVPRRLLLVGTAGPVNELLAESGRERSRFQIIGCVDDTAASAPAGVRLFGAVDDLPEVIARERPDIIVVALAAGRPLAFGHLLMQAEAGFTVIEIAEFFEHAFGRVPVRNLERAWFMGMLHLYQRRYSTVAKRCFDIAIASLLALIAIPAFPILVCLVRMTPGPIFVRQQRIGEHGRRFVMYKLRTMRFDAEPDGEAFWSTQGDPRVTSVGKLMRMWRLDELPQLLNVFRGEMSIVGPRPERPEFLAQLEETVPFWSRRHLVKPGITGWAQVRRGYTSDAEGHTQKLSYDLWYLRHRSLLVDMAILLKTFVVLVKGGAPKAAVVTRTIDASVARGEDGSVEELATVALRRARGTAAGQQVQGRSASR